MGRLPTLLAAAAASGAGAARIGSGADLFAQFAPAFAAAKRGAGALEETSMVLPTGAGGVVEVDLSDAEVDAEGVYMAANGRVHGVAASDFMMKGTAEDMYGWVTYEDEGRALEYRSLDDGAVDVREVALEEVKPGCGVQTEEEAVANLTEADRRAYEALAERHEGTYNGQDIRYLQSLPGAKAVLMLDIDVFFRNKALNDDVTRYSKRHFYENWQTVAAGFSMFELNVVTDWEVYRRASIRDRGLACFFDEDGRSYAHPYSFGSNRCGSYNYRQKTGYGLGRMTLHEVGHQFGLEHHGDVLSSGHWREYSNGLPEFKYVPIMGNFWVGKGWGGDALYQWSKGEYAGATRTYQDDLRLIQRYVARRQDDIRGNVPLKIADTAVRAAENRGKIADSQDSDAFTFAVGSGGGRVDLDVDRTEYVGGAMLDVEATLLNAEGKVVARSNPTARRSASIDVRVAAGEYTLVVRGGAEGTPSHGFSRYGSLGNYAISGRVTGASDSGGTPPTPPSQLTPQPTAAPRTPVPPTPLPLTPLPPLASPVPATAVPPTLVPTTATPSTPEPTETPPSATPRPTLTPRPTPRPIPRPTPKPPTSTPPPPVAGAKWYASWGSMVCSNKGAPSWIKTFATQEACCKSNFHWKMKRCMAAGADAGGTPATPKPTAAPVVPTPIPTTATPPTPVPTTAVPRAVVTPAPVVTGSPVPEPPATPAPEGKWWPKWWPLSGCVEGDAGRPPWQVTVATKAECCAQYFSWKQRRCVMA